MMSDELRILQILLFPLQGSGSGTYAERLAEFEQRRGHTVRVLCCDHTAPRQSFETAVLLFRPDREPSLQVDLDFNFPAFTTHPLSPTTTFGSLSPAQREAYIAAFQRKIAQEVEQFQPDIVHAHHGWVIGAALAELRAERRVPYVISLHGTEHYGFVSYPAYRDLALKGLRQADRVLALTEDQRDLALTTYQLTPERITLIASGVDTEVYRPVAVNKAQLLAQHGVPEIDRPIVFSGSKLATFKGIDVLLRAAARYESLPEQPVTLIAGEGDERQRLEALCGELNLRRVYFLGHQSAARMVEWYNVADVSVLPSRHDWFPLVSVESLACGTPLVASAVGGLTKVVTDEVGYLVPPEDPIGLAEAIGTMIRSGFKSIAHEACLRRARDHFSWDSTVDQIITVYHEVLSV